MRWPTRSMDSPSAGVGSRPASHSFVRSFQDRPAPAGSATEVHGPQARLDSGQRQAEGRAHPLGGLAGPPGWRGEDVAHAEPREGPTRRLRLLPAERGEVVELFGREAGDGLEVGQGLAVAHEEDAEGSRRERRQGAEGVVGERGRGRE